jgi:hypothetical protein
MGPRAKYLAAAAVALSLSGCGGSGAFNPDASRPQTRFAVAQEVESRAAARFGAAEGLDALSTICISSTESNTSWTCTSNYAPSDGTITSLQQMAAVTRVTYDSGMHTFVLASDEAQTGSPGLTGTVPLSTIAKVVKTDGSSTGEPPATGPGFVATSTTRSQMSESSLSTMAALLSPARKSALLKAVALLNGTPPAEREIAFRRPPALLPLLLLVRV